MAKRVAYVWRIYHRNINNRNSYIAHRTRTQTSVALLLLLPAVDDVVANDSDNGDDDRNVYFILSVSVSHRSDGLLRASNIHHGSTCSFSVAVYFWIVKSVDTRQLYSCSFRLLCAISVEITFRFQFSTLYTQRASDRIQRSNYVI